MATIKLELGDLSGRNKGLIAGFIVLVLGVIGWSTYRASVQDTAELEAIAQLKGIVERQARYADEHPDADTLFARNLTELGVPHLEAGVSGYRFELHATGAAEAVAVDEGGLFSPSRNFYLQGGADTSVRYRDGRRASAASDAYRRGIGDRRPGSGSLFRLLW